MVRQVYNVYNSIRTGWHTDVEVDLNLLENERLGAGIVNWRLRPHPALGPLLLNILAELFFLHESLAAAAAEVVVHVVESVVEHVVVVIVAATLLRRGAGRPLSPGTGVLLAGPASASSFEAAHRSIFQKSLQSGIKNFRSKTIFLSIGGNRLSFK